MKLMNKPFASSTYLLLIVSLIFIFNGIFALLQFMNLLLSGQDFLPEWRIINILVGLGLLSRKRLWYVVACISLLLTAFSHVYWLYYLIDSPISVIWYLGVGLALIIFQFVILMRADIRALYFHRLETK